MATINNIEKYNYQLGDTGLGFSSLNVFTSAASEGFEGTITDLIRDTADKYAGGLGDQDVIKGSEANAMYNLSDEVKFKEDEDVPLYKVEDVGERHIERTLNEAELNLAKQTNAGGFTGFVGQLAGGMLDIGVFAGGKLGAFAVSKVPALANATSGLGTFTKAAVDNMIGAALIDAPALAINRAMHNEDFRKDEYLMMVGGAGLLGGAFGVGAKMVRGMRSQLGDNADEIMQTVEGIRRYRKKRGTNFDVDTTTSINDTDIIIDVRNREIHTLRSHQNEYEFSPVLDAETVKTKTYYGSYSKGTAKLYQDSGMGSGALFFSDNPNIMENAVNSLDNMKKGNVVSFNVNQANIAGSAEFPTIKEKIIEKYPHTASKIADLDDPHEIMAELSEVLDKHVDAAFVFNKAAIDAGFDGYAAKGFDLKGENTHNGLVLLDKRSFGIKTKNKMTKFNSEGLNLDPDMVTKLGEYEGANIAPDDVVAQELNAQAAMDAERMVTRNEDKIEPPSYDTKTATAISASEDSVTMDIRAAEMREYIASAELTPAQRESLEIQLKLIDDPSTTDKVLKGFEQCVLGGTGV